MKYFALIYELVEGYLEKRGQYREEHLRCARESFGVGNLILAGAFSEPADRALLVFLCTDKTIPETFAKNDPYVINGLVKKWEVRPWTVVVGNE